MANALATSTSTWHALCARAGKESETGSLSSATAFGVTVGTQHISRIGQAWDSKSRPSVRMLHAVAQQLSMNITSSDVSAGQGWHVGR